MNEQQNEELKEKIEGMIESVAKPKNAMDKGKFIAAIFAVIISIVIIIITQVSGGVSIFSNITKLFKILDILSSAFLIICVVGLIICITLLIIKKRSKYLFIWIAIFSFLLAASSYIKDIINDGKMGDITSDNVVLKDYTEVEKIEIGSLKIPSLYSVVGKREIVNTFKFEDKVMENSEYKYDSIMLIYVSISEEDKLKYANELIRFGFAEEDLESNEGIKNYVYEYENQTYMVSIDHEIINYINIDVGFDEFKENFK